MVHRTASVEGDVIRYREGAQQKCSVPIDEIAIVGEETNEASPHFDDYFVCIITRDGTCFPFACETAGMDQVVDHLSRRWGAQLSFKLANSTKLASRIVWPTSAADQPLFHYSPQAPSTLLRKALSHLGYWPPEYERAFTPEASRFLTST